MTNKKPKKRGSKESQYAIRQRGEVLLRSGKYRHKEISDILGVAVGTVRGWSSKLKKSRNILKSNKKRGCPKGKYKLLNKRQESSIIKIIKDKTPKQMKLEFYLWSLGAVMELIEQKFGIKLSESSMRNYLKSWGFTTQRPAIRYSRRDDIVIERWLTEDYPEIAKRAETEGAEIHWLDEASVNNQTIYQRSYAPKGKTPVAEKPSKKERINMISTVTNRGKMRFKLSEESI